MSGILTTALIGLFALSSASAINAPAEQAIEIDYPKLTVSMTGYNAVPEQTDGDPFTTASGAFSNPEVVAARSVDLKEDLPFGTIIEVIGVNASTSPNCGFSVVEQHLGYRVIADSMHPRKRNQIDILLHNEPTIRAAGRVVNPAVALGVCKEVEIRILGTTTIKNIPSSQAALKRIVEEQELALKKF